MRLIKFPLQQKIQQENSYSRNTFAKAQEFLDQNKEKIRKRINFCVHRSPYDFDDFMSEALLVVVGCNVNPNNFKDIIIHNIFEKFAEMIDNAIICPIDNEITKEQQNYQYKDNTYLLERAIKKLPYTKIKTAYKFTAKNNLSLRRKKDIKRLRVVISSKYRKFYSISQPGFNYLLTPSKKISKNR